jgi:enoyl-CoA hydratase/carnithine racemase
METRIMSYTAISYELTGKTALIKLNRPDQMNAWTDAMSTELGLALQQANLDDNVRAIVITGEGRAFCAGADLQAGAGTFAGRTEEEGIEAAGLKDVNPYDVDKPVIAAINGAAVGVGMTYPMMCDIRIVADDAKLGFVFTRRGMMPEFAAHLLVQRVAGLSNAADLLLSGRIFLGSEAAALGIASQSVPKDKVLEVALAKAKEYELTAPVSVAITKRLLWAGLDSSLSEMLKKESPLFDWIGNQADAKEGVMSFMEKREPEWSMSVSRDMPDDLLGSTFKQ